MVVIAANTAKSFKFKIMTEKKPLKRKIKVSEIDKKIDYKKITKIVSGKKLWNYDNLEPTERKGAI